MKKLFLILPLLFLTAFIFSTKVFSAQPDFKPKNTVTIPRTAVEVAPSLYYLGEAVDIDGRKVEGYAIIRRHREYARAVKPPKGGETSCYGFLASGAKWKTPEGWKVNPANSRSLATDLVFNNLGTDIGKWEEAAGRNILGDGASTEEVLAADTQSPDGENEVYFANVDSPGAIAITIVWGIFGGPPFGRQLVEWDQVYDDTDYDWSSTGEAVKMDFENIATHELGHSVGMADLYQIACGEQTMYGYADFGETKKRDLATGDIAGVKKLYQ